MRIGIVCGLTFAAAFQIAIHLILSGRIPVTAGFRLISALAIVTLVISYARDYVGHLLALQCLVVCLVFSDSRGTLAQGFALPLELVQLWISLFCILGWRAELLGFRTGIAELLSITSAFSISLVIVIDSPWYGGGKIGLGGVFINVVLLGLILPSALRKNLSSV